MLKKFVFIKELNCPVIVGKKLIDKNYFFAKPFKSSLIGIYEVNKQSALKFWPITEVITKYVLFKYKQNFITFPILHSA